MNNDYGLINLWVEGDGVTRFVALLLLAMSLASWIVILLKTLNLLTARKQAARIEAFWHSADVNTGLKTLGDEADNPFRQLAQQGMQALAHLKTSGAQADLVEKFAQKIFARFALPVFLDISIKLSTTSSIAPSREYSPVKLIMKSFLLSLILLCSIAVLIYALV
jgi:biopolymer transport protein ExbB/TolQ